MFFPIRELELRAKPFVIEIPAGEFDLDPKFRAVSPLRAQGKVELESGSLAEIRVSGQLSTRVEAECDRCLEKAEFAVESDFNLLYRPASVDYGDELELGDADAEIGFYEGDGVELNDVLREFVLLALPMQRLCREDCKGLCPVCGQSRNLSECQCVSSRIDDRWAALKSLQ